MAAVLERLAIGAMATPLNTGATLATNAAALSAAFNNTTGSTGDGYREGIVTLSVTFSGGAPTANTGISGWFIMSNDAAGGTYEDASGTGPIIPARPADFVIPVRAITTIQVIARRVELQPGLFKVFVRNDGTGQTMDNTWTLTLTPITASYT